MSRHDTRDDAELIRALRENDKAAFEELWRRHSGAARRYALRVFPANAEDLVSESFLAVYQQITQTDKGPQFAFRSYLKTVIRNTAIAWKVESEHVITTEFVDDVSLADGLHALEQKVKKEDVIEAFQSLPERWQRLLWLTEVTETKRPEIARELGISPNAVSALQRRARAGLRVQWLTQQIPATLRADEQHAARLFPQYLTEPKNISVAADVSAHVARCAVCRDLLQGIRSEGTRLQRKTLAVLLASTGVGLPASAALAPGSATVAAAVAAAAVPAAGVTGWLVAGGVSIATISGLVISTLASPPAPPESGAVISTELTDRDPAPVLSLNQVPTEPRSEPPAPSSDPPAPVLLAPRAPVTGRHIIDPDIPSAALSDDPAQVTPVPPRRPATSAPDTPRSGADSSAELSPGVASPAESTGFLGPVLYGQTVPGNQVVVEVAPERFSPEVAADGGWQFDTRALQKEAGTYAYQVWANGPHTQSVPTEGSFTIVPLEVQGFDAVSGFEDMGAAEARSTGLVISLDGPANGEVFITTMQGLSAVVPLDENGHARRRLLMTAPGWYHFTLRAMDHDGFWGAGHEAAVDVYDPAVVFSPWQSLPEEMGFELVEVD